MTLMIMLTMLSHCCNYDSGCCIDDGGGGGNVGCFFSINFKPITCTSNCEQQQMTAYITETRENIARMYVIHYQPQAGATQQMVVNVSGLCTNTSSHFVLHWSLIHNCWHACKYEYSYKISPKQVF